MNQGLGRLFRLSIIDSFSSITNIALPFKLHLPIHNWYSPKISLLGSSEIRSGTSWSTHDQSKAGWGFLSLVRMTEVGNGLFALRHNNSTMKHLIRLFSLRRYSRRVDGKPPSLTIATVICLSCDIVRCRAKPTLTEMHWMPDSACGLLYLLRAENIPSACDVANKNYTALVQRPCQECVIGFISDAVRKSLASYHALGSLGLVIPRKWRIQLISDDYLSIWYGQIGNSCRSWERIQKNNNETMLQLSFGYDCSKRLLHACEQCYGGKGSQPQQIFKQQIRIQPLK